MPVSRKSKSTDTSQTPTDGLVIVNYGKSMLVEDGAGSLHRCVARRSLGTIVCGDRVSWQQSGKQADGA